MSDINNLSHTEKHLNVSKSSNMILLKENMAKTVGRQD